MGPLNSSGATKQDRIIPVASLTSSSLSGDPPACETSDSPPMVTDSHSLRRLSYSRSAFIRSDSRSSNSKPPR